MFLESPRVRFQSYIWMAGASRFVVFINVLGVGEIQEAIFEEKIFRIFFTQKKVFFLASQYKTGLYLDLLLENRI